MANIKLYPKDAIFIPGKGLEKELADIIQEYASVLKERGVELPFNLNAFSKFNKDFEKALDDVYNYISNAANEGDVAAEKTFVKIDEFLDYDSPNYFVIQKEVETNIQAAEFGDVFSQGMLGDRYYYGKGVEKDFCKAAYWYRIAAEQGVALAQYNIAGCYELGRGVEKDKEKARDWYKSAAENGVREAKRALKRFELEVLLSEDELLSYKPTYIWENEKETSWKDEYGVEYSENGKRLLNAPSDIKEYIIKEGTEVICDGAFYNCENLISVVVPQSVVVIGDYAFKRCKSLKTIELPIPLREIGESAFECTGLQCVDIPENVISIGEEAYRECYDLKTLKISKNVKDIGSRIIAWDEKLKTIYVSPENKYYDSRCNCNAIIESKSNKLIVGCGSSTIPEGINSIGEEAFFSCNSLTNIKIPNGVTVIGESSFSNCKNLEFVSLSDSVQTIEARAFEWCNNLKKIILGRGLTKVGFYAFEGCTSLEVCDLPEGLETIEEMAFERCISLTHLDIPNSVTRIEDGAFYGCDGLESVSLSNSLKKIAKEVFLGCRKISTIQIPDGVKIIGKYAFQYCKGLNKIILPNSVALIEVGAFDDCDGIDVHLRINQVEIQSADNDSNRIPSSTTYLKEIVSRVRYNGTNKKDD